MREILLVGNPNTGKTTLFNSLTRSDEHIGNWHGVTVETKEKQFSALGEQFLLIDTPGIYSLDGLSFEESVAIKAIREKKRKILNICDQNNLGRNLYLTLCLLEEGCDVVLAVNQINKRPILTLNAQKLSRALGIDVVVIDAEKKVGFEDLQKALLKPEKATVVPYEKVDDLKQMSMTRYSHIEKLISACTKSTGKTYGKSKLDKIFLNKFLAFPIFLCVLLCIFYLTFFSLGAFLSDLLGEFLNILSKPILNFLSLRFGQNFVYNFFETAIFGGLGTVLSFLPQVVLLFFFLSILEDSGYMARIAFIFEDILGKIGLSGKSVYTLLMGFGCSTSAIMTARNMDDKNAKIKTAMLCPYMSCSAKIPIYTVLGGAFFGRKNLFVIAGMYVLGVVVAILISKIFDKTVLKSKNQTFILEFPPYRTTSLKRVGKIIWKNTKEFVVRVGSVMLCMNVIVFMLSSFNFRFQYVQSGSILEAFGKFLTPLFKPLGFGSWAIVCSLLAGLVAKEVVVSSIAMFNGIEPSATRLISSSILLPTSLVYFSNSASVISFLVFCLLYTPCIASISMLLQEVGKKWTAISIVIQLLSAYVTSFVVYNLLKHHLFAYVFIGGIVIFSFCLVILKIRRKKICGNCGNCKKKCKTKISK